MAEVIERAVSSKMYKLFVFPTEYIYAFSVIHTINSYYFP
jgi:hypothetical protein